MSSKTKELLKILKPIVSFPRRNTVRFVSHIDPLPTRYGGKTTITILPGLGIGPEIMHVTLDILEAAHAPLTFETLNIEPTADERSTEFREILTSIRRNKVALKGNIELKSKDPYLSSRNVLLRKSLDLFAYVLHCKTNPAIKSKFGEIDVVVIRQNTEGEYLMLEHEPTPTTVESLKIVTRAACERLARFAFNFALKYQRKKITVVHNADIQRRTEGLFVEAAENVSKEYPSIEMNILEIGVCVTTLLKAPQLFDIILATNLNGSMLSNVLNGMVGGPGVTAGTNLGGKGLAVFEPGARNKGSSIVGQGIANPVGMITAAINLLNYLGNHKTSQTIEHAVYMTLIHDKILTPDLGGKATTDQMATKIKQHIAKQFIPKSQHHDPEHGRWKTYCELPSDNKKKS